MSKPRNPKPHEILILLGLGGCLAIAAAHGLLPHYMTRNDQRTVEYYLLVTYLVLMPPALLGYVRKNIARKNGDWRILLLIWALTMGLVFVLTGPGPR